jgi:integrase
MRALTVRQINAATQGRHYLGDGLCFIKNGNGKSKWIFRYTSPLTRRPNETTIGPYPAFSYSEARAEAARLQALVAKKQDPVQAKRQNKFNGITYAQACDAFIKHNALHRWRSTKNVKNLLGQAKSLDAIPVGAITPPMIKEALMPVWERHPYQVIRALPMIASVFRYAKFMNWCAGENPAGWKGNMENVFGGLKKRDNHHPSLPFKEAPDFMRRLRLREKRGVSALALEFLILTAARTEEVLGLRWSEIDLTNRVVVLPPERTKQDRQHRVPLSERCMEILALQQEYRTSEFVFTGYNRTHMDEKVLRVLIKSMDETMPVRDPDGRLAVPHGFRHSFKNWTFATRQDRDLAELSLGHDAAEDRTEGAYLTVDGLEERRPLMEEWALYCAGHSLAGGGEEAA